MSWRLANSLTTLRNQINEAYPNRNRASDGTIGDQAHSSTVSQHNPNGAGVVTAMDITHDPANGVSGGALAEIMIRDPRTWYVIWNSRIWETGVGWQAYYGSNPHSSHVHISTKQDAASYDNGNNWNIGEEIMEAGDIKNFTSAVFQVKADANDLAQAGKPWKTVMYYLADKYQKPIALWKRQGVLDQNDIKNFAKAVFKTTATADDLKLASLGWKEGMYALATKYQNNIVSVNKEPSTEAEQKIKKIKEIVG